MESEKVHENHFQLWEADVTAESSWEPRPPGKRFPSSPGRPAHMQGPRPNKPHPAMPLKIASWETQLLTGDGASLWKGKAVSQCFSNFLLNSEAQMYTADESKAALAAGCQAKGGLPLSLLDTSAEPICDSSRHGKRVPQRLETAAANLSGTGPEGQH